MPFISLTATLPQRISKKRYLAAWSDYMEEALREAGRQFILAAYPAIPVKTGMARGSLKAQVNSEQSAFSFFHTTFTMTPSQYNKKYYVYPGQEHMERISLRSFDEYKPRANTTEPALGWIPKDAKSGAALSAYTVKRTGFNLEFNFDSAVRHYKTHDDTWRSVNLGYIAFKSSLKRSLKRVPSFLSYLEYGTISNGIIQTGRVNVHG